MSVPDLTLLVYYGEGKEVEVKVPAEFTVDRAKKAILAKVPEFAGAQTSEYLLSIAGAFLTTEFSKLGTLEVVRESDLSQPIKVKLLRRVKIRGGIVSPRPGHIATTWEPATQPKAGTPRRHSHSTELSPVTEESFEHEEAQELRIELAQRDKLIAQQKRELDNLASYNAELVRLLEAHSIPVPPAPHTTLTTAPAAARPPDQARVDKKHTTVPTLTTTAADPPKPKPVDKKKSDEKQKKEKNAEESNREEKEASSDAGGKQRKSGGGGGSSRAPEEVVSGGPTSPKTKEAKEAAAAGAPTKKKQKSKEKDEKEKEKKEKDKEKETKRKKKFTWKSAGKKQGAAMKDALARGDVDAEDVTEEQAPTLQAEAESQKPETTADSSNDDASEARKRDSGTLQDPGSTPTKAKASAVASQVAAPSPPQSPATTAKSPHSPLIASLASEDSRGNKRNSLSNIWRKGKKDRSDSIGSSPSRERRAESVPSGATSEAMPFPGIRFHQTTSSLEDLVAAAGADDDQQQPQPVAGVSADPSDLVAATVGGSAASAVEESSTREGRSGSGGGSGVFGKRNSRGKKASKDSRGSGSGIRSPKTTESVDNNKIEAPAKEETAVVSDGEKAAEGAESAPPAKRERSESANARRGTMAFYDVMRAGAEKMVVAGDLEATSPKNESEDEKKNENGDANENGGVEAEQEKKENAAVPPTENGENTGGAEEVKKVVERKLTPEEHAQKIREEFIKTEEKYTQNLDILLTQYMTPLRQAAAATNEEERIIATKEVEKIFSRELSLLQTMHSHLLKELKVSTTSSEFIDAFFSFVPYLKTYTAYVNNFTTSNKALSELIKSNAKLQKFIQDTYERLNAEFVKEAGEEKMSDNQTQVDLRGLLIMPIQRLPRYELLLRDLAKHTTESEDENEKLQKLLKDVQKLNQHINEAKRKDENTNKLVEIQNAIKTKGDKAFTLFDRVGRQFVREGKLETRELHTDPAKKIPGFARGYVFLFDDLLVLTKPEKGGADAPRTYVLVKAYSLSGYTASSHFELASCEVEEKEKERIISLVPIEKEGRVIQLKAHSAPDRQVWLDDVSKHIQHALQRVLGSTPTPPANRKGS